MLEVLTSLTLLFLKKGVCLFECICRLLCNCSWASKKHCVKGPAGKKGNSCITLLEVNCNSFSFLILLD
jgi:hypothetical protein